MDNFRGAIFDLDGTLLDSTGIWSKIDEEFLTKRGLSVPPNYSAEVAALRFEETAEYTIKRFDLTETPAELMAEWTQMALQAYTHKVTLKTGARTYLEQLKTWGVKIATATSLSRPLCETALRSNQIHHLFDVICTTDEVLRGKHFPDVFLFAAQKLQVPPQDCVVFEDLLPGIKSAQKAGMKVYGVYDAQEQRDWSEICALADGYLEDFNQAPLPFTNRPENPKDLRP